MPDTDSLARERADIALRTAEAAATAASSAATAAQTATLAVQAHAAQCEERERHHEQAHAAFQESLRDHITRIDKTVDRIEHDGRNMRQEAIAMHGDFKRTVGEDLKSARTEAVDEREKIKCEIRHVQNLLWGGLVFLVILQLGVIGSLIKVVFFGAK